jgi:hypothetical protein
MYLINIYSYISLISSRIETYLNYFIHSPYCIVRFGFLLPFTLLYLLFFNFNHIWLYLIFVYLILSLLIYYDNCTRVDSQQEFDLFSKILNIIDGLLNSLTTPSELNIADVYNFFLNKIITLIGPFMANLDLYFEIYIDAYDSGSINLRDIFFFFILDIISIPINFFIWLLFDDMIFYKIFYNT